MSECGFNFTFLCTSASFFLHLSQSTEASESSEGSRVNVMYGRSGFLCQERWTERNETRGKSACRERRREEAALRNRGEDGGGKRWLGGGGGGSTVVRRVNSASSWKLTLLRGSRGGGGKEEIREWMRSERRWQKTTEQRVPAERCCRETEPRRNNVSAFHHFNLQHRLLSSNRHLPLTPHTCPHSHFRERCVCVWHQTSCFQNKSLPQSVSSAAAQRGRRHVQPD